MVRIPPNTKSSVAALDSSPAAVAFLAGRDGLLVVVEPRR